MDKPRWATKKQLRWKVVNCSRRSIMRPKDRITECCAGDVGSTLKYPSKKLVVSPNGVCVLKHHSCCRGIVAWRQLTSAKNQACFNTWRGDSKIIAIYAKTWVEAEHTSRTNRVYVE